MKIITIFLPSCFFLMSRAVTLYMATLTIKGRNTRDNSSLDDETERKDTSGQADSNLTTDDNNSVNVLLGASNCKRLGKVSPNCINASISGATLDNIDETPFSRENITYTNYRIREITFYLVYCMCKININLVMITFRLCNVVCT
jgi:hypothetical protein